MLFRLALTSASETITESISAFATSSLLTIKFNKEYEEVFEGQLFVEWNDLPEQTRAFFLKYGISGRMRHYLKTRTYPEDRDDLIKVEIPYFWDFFSPDEFRVFLDDYFTIMEIHKPVLPDPPCRLSRS